MLHLVTQLRPDIQVIYSDNGPALVPRTVHREVLAIARSAGATVFRVDAPLDVDRVAAEGFDLVFVGLRREESLRRRRRMDGGRWFGPIPECWPLAHWTWMDVWGYLVAHEIPYVSLYDAQAAIVGYDQARFHTLFDPKMDKYSASTVDGLTAWRLRGR